MKKLLSNLLAALIGLLFILIVLEIWFRWVWPATDVPFGTYDEQFKVPKFSNSIKEGQYTIGKNGEKGGYWKVNNEGWMSGVDYTTTKAKEKRIGVIGDSYVEALQVDFDKSFHALLRQELEETTDVIAVGHSGAPLSQYYQLTQYVEQKFNPDFYIVNVVHNDFDESLCKIKNISGWRCVEIENDKAKFNKLDKGLGEAKLSTRMLSKLATFRYLIHNLKVQQLNFSMGASAKKDEENLKERFNANIDVKKVAGLKDEISLAFDLILDAFDKDFKDKKVLFVMDGLRMEIYKDSNLDQSNIAWMSQLLKEKIEARKNLYFLDMTAAFKNHYSENGFHFESELDWHWNSRGHQIVSHAVLEKLQTDSIIQ